MSTDIKFRIDQISKIIQSGESFGSLTNVAIPLARDNLPGLVNNLASNEKNEFERKINGKGAVRAGKRFIWFISNEDLTDINKIIRLLEDSNVLVDGITETVKH